MPGSFVRFQSFDVHARPFVAWRGESDGADIQRCQPSTVGFLEASTIEFSQRCQPGNVGFLEASTIEFSKRCQPGNVGFLEASRIELGSRPSFQVL